jgi:hypothetical protein
VREIHIAIRLPAERLGRGRAQGEDRSSPTVLI